MNHVTLNKSYVTPKLFDEPTFTENKSDDTKRPLENLSHTGRFRGLGLGEFHMTIKIQIIKFIYYEKIENKYDHGFRYSLVVFQLCLA